MRFGSLFSGIGGFDLGFEQAGLTCVWQVELDADCNRVLEKHWSGVARHKDVRDIGQLESVDVICGGFPCQDLSVAGKRAGLAGERSGLWFEFLRIVGLNKPEWVVIENVPGLFSSNEGEDLTVILDGLEAAGYVFDADVLDAQYHGVAQRRRRLFIVCQLAESILTKKTISSALTIAQCLTESSLLVLIAARSPLATSLENLTFDAGEPNHSLKQRMMLFGMLKDGAALTLAESLAVLPQSCGCELADSESNHGKNTPADSKTLRATRCPGSTPLTDAPEGCQNIERSWNPLLAECLQVMSECITSTRSSEITESRIYSCALLTLRIAERIILSPPSCPTFWSAALSTLTAMRAFTDYARQASSSLFTEPIWLQPWRDFIGQAIPVCESLGSIGVGSFEQVFPLSESVSWNPPTRREARAGVTPILEAGARTNCDGRRDGDGIGVEGDPMFTLQSGKQHAVAANNFGERDISTALSSKNERIDGDTETFVVAATLKQRGRGACDEVMDNLQVAGTLAAHSKEHGHAMTTQQAAESNHLVAMPLKAKANSSHDESHETYIYHENIDGKVYESNESPALRNFQKDAPMVVTHALRSEGADASEDGTGRGTPLVVDRLEHHRFHCLTCGQWFGVNDYDERIVTCPSCGETHIDSITDVLDGPDIAATLNSGGNNGGFRSEPGERLVPVAYRTAGNCGPFEQGDKTAALNTATDPNQTIIAFSSKDHGADAGEIAPTLRSQNFKDSHMNGGGQVAIAFSAGQGAKARSLAESIEHTPPLKAAESGTNKVPSVSGGFGVRRLTPRECERLQGFPADFTRWDAQGKEISDSARYRMLGNAVAVPVARWIGKRFVFVGGREK